MWGLIWVRFADYALICNLVDLGHESVESLLRDDTGRIKELASQLGETLDNIDERKLRGQMFNDLQGTKKQGRIRSRRCSHIAGIRCMACVAKTSGETDQ